MNNFFQNQIKKEKDVAVKIFRGNNMNGSARKTGIRRHIKPDENIANAHNGHDGENRK